VPDVLSILLIGNAALIGVAFIMLLILVRWGYKFEFNYGIDRIQGPLKVKIVTLLLLFLLLGVAAVAFNVLTPVFIQ
jgi:hypothetical protein